MTKIIKINKGSECPHFSCISSHKPVCKHPKTLVSRPYSQDRLCSYDTIPSFCPLEGQ